MSQDLVIRTIDSLVLVLKNEELAAQSFGFQHKGIGCPKFYSLVLVSKTNSPAARTPNSIALVPQNKELAVRAFDSLVFGAKTKDLAVRAPNSSVLGCKAEELSVRILNPFQLWATGSRCPNTWFLDSGAKTEELAIRTFKS